MMQEPSLIFDPAKNQARRVINRAPRRDAIRQLEARLSRDRWTKGVSIIELRYTRRILIRSHLS